MKNGLLVLNGILVLAVGYLIYSKFSTKKEPLAISAASRDSSKSPDPFRIAYFEMDSVEANFSMVKDVKSELSHKEESMNGELEKMNNDYREKLNEYQQKAQSMTQVQSENATQELQRIQQEMQTRKQALDQDYNEYVAHRMKDIKTKIEEFLKTYNKNNYYTYIVSYEQGLFYYKDTAYNITGDVIKGLNDIYHVKQ